MAKLVSAAYGEALFEMALEAGEEKMRELLEELESLRKILGESPQLDELMKHPGIPKQEKLRVAAEIFHGRISSELEGLLQVVISKERYRELPAIFDYFIEKVKEQQKIGVAYVVSAVELSGEQRAATEKRLLETSGYRKMEMHFAVDKTLIGGMTIRIGDRVVDSSIRTKLDGLKRQLLQIQLG